MKEGLEDIGQTLSKEGRLFGLPYLLALKAESLHRPNRTPEALNMIREAIARPVTYSIRWWLAELLRLPGVFLVAIGADESGIGLIVLHSHRKRQNRLSFPVKTD